MNALKGKLFKIDEHKATIEKKIKGLKVKISMLNETDVEITHKKVFKGSAVGSLVSFGSKIVVLHLRYRWLEAYSRILTGLYASATTGQAIEAKAENQANSGLYAHAKAEDAQEANIDSSVKIGLFAKAVSYVIAKAVHIIQMFMGHRAEATTGKGAVAESVKEMPLHVKHDAISADSVEGEPENNPCLTGLTASGGSAPTQEAFIDTSFIVEGSAIVGTGDSLSLVASVGIGIGCYAKAMAWGYQVINGVLYIPYSYQATQTDDLLYLGVIPETWDSPYLDGSGALVIGQARLTKQEENILGVI